MITFLYTNHKGETRQRRLEPDSLEFHFSPGFGYQPGWFLSGHDLDKDARRSFALSRIQLGEESGVKFRSRPFVLAQLGRQAQQYVRYQTGAGKIFWTTLCENPLAAIEFALELDPADAADFLRAWREGSVEEWPEFVTKVEGAKQ